VGGDLDPVDFRFLRSLAPDQRSTVLAAARHRSYQRGDIIFHEGEPGTSLFLIVEGRVAVQSTTPDGDTAMLTVLGPGDAFGEIALVRADERHTATVIALEATVALTIARADFEELRRREPSIDRFLVEVLVAAVTRLSAQLMEAYFLPAETRILRRLVVLAEVYGRGGSAALVPLPQAAIATAAGTSRATVNRALRALESEELIRLHRGGLTILDREELARRAT
jgi:CRP/FNR family transcriptional regulator, cyclic AMP receptor protein